MVAIFTGGGTGIERSSARVLGGSGLLGSATLGRSGEQAYVNAASGNLMLTAVDEMLLGRGPDAVVSRTYNSFGGWDGDNNDSWRASGYRRVFGLTGGTGYGTAGSTVKRTDWDGSEVTYSWDATNSAYVATDGAGAYDMLTRSGTNWTWVDGETQVREDYDDSNSGRITSRSDTSGNNSVTYGYTGSLLTRITTADGGYTQLQYGGTGGLQLQYLETHSVSPAVTSTRVFYEYDASNRLSKVKVNLNPLDNSAAVTSGVPATYNYETSYTYDGTSQRVASISQSDGTLVEFKYDTSFRVSKITETIGGGAPQRVTDIAYDTVARITTVTDALGQATRLGYDASGNLLSLILPPSGTGDPAPAVSFTYEANGDLATMTSAGNTTTYGYDNRGNRTLERDSLGNTVTRTFSGTNLYTGANTPSFWTGSNATIAQVTGTPAGTALSMTATANNLSIAIPATQQVPVAAGDTLTFTVQLVGGNFTTASLALLGGTSLYGNNGDSSAVILSGPGTLSQITGGAFQVSGLSTTAVTTVSVTRRFTQAEYVQSRVFVGSASAGTTSGNSIIFANANLAVSRNLYTGANTPAFWTGSNATITQVTGTPAGTALSMTATANNLSIAIPATQQVPVAAGDTLTFTVQLIGGN
ncbi:RHS repeat protein, partial [Sphingomonas sp. ERG5]|uniref:RHS repeat protein n=1 Tax=Sphingomonas sp. ERG5 TaxID=1381597 RepID=UPI00054B9395